MFNRSKALINAFTCAFGTKRSVNVTNVAAPAKPLKQSRGKSGKVSHKPSGAATLKRAATKRNNIRKHR